jgi:hypothetical protein
MSDDFTAQEPSMIFWVAYKQVEDKKMYLSDDKKHLRIYKTETALREYLKLTMSEEDIKTIIVHPISGKIAVPVEDTEPEKIVVSTSAKNVLPPSASELLEIYAHKRRKAHRERK